MDNPNYQAPGIADPNPAEIARLSQRIGFPDLGMQSIAAHETVAQFRNRLLLAGAAQTADIGMSRKELAEYNLGAAIEATGQAGDGRIGGLAGVISDELAKRYAVQLTPHKLLVPTDYVRHHVKAALQTRADSAGVLSAGGYLIETENAGFVGLALARALRGQLPIQTIEGLVGNVNLVVAKTAGAQTDLPSDTTQANNVGQTFGQVSLTPKGEGVYFEQSRLLLKQTSPTAQAFLVNQVLRAFAARLEFLMLQGSGVAGQPLGLLNAATGSVTGTSLALAGVLGFQTQVGDRLSESGAYVTTQAVAALLAARQKATGTSSFLWEGNLYNGTVGGFPALSTSNMPSAKMLFGAWDMAVIASWGALAIEVNPFANFQAGIVGMRIFHDFDVAALDPSAFAIASGVT